MALKTYQILSEDARCNLYFALENVTGHDHIACECYKGLIDVLSGGQPVLKLNVRDASVWRHLI